jgi:hypothetical protein
VFGFCVLVERCCAELLLSTNISGQLEHTLQLFDFFLILNLTKLLESLNEIQLLTQLQHIMRISRARTHNAWTHWALAMAAAQHNSGHG